MIEKMLALIGILGVSLFCGLTGGDWAKLKNVEAELAQTKQEREALEVKMYELSHEREQLQKQIEELTDSRNELSESLAQTKVERDAAEVQRHALSQERDRLRKQIKELTDSREQLKGELAEQEKLQEQIDGLTLIRTELQKKNDELTRSLATAAAEAKTARDRIEELAKKLEVETEKVRLLQDQLMQVQAELAGSQSKDK